MAVRSDPPVHAQPFRQGPALALAWRLETSALWRRRVAEPARATATVVALTLLASLAIDTALSKSHEEISALLALLNSNPFTVGLFGALVAFVRMQTHRRRAERDHAASWLATAPIERRDVVAFLRRRAAASALPIGITVVALIAALGWVDERSVRDVCLFLGIGLGAGAIAGWRSGAHAPAAVLPPLPRLRDRVGASTSAAGFDALRRWPFAQMLASVNPRQHARIVAAVLLGLPMGIPLSVAVLLLLLLATSLGAVALLQALLATIPRAADGLRSTPLPLSQLAALLSVRAFACQVAAAAFAAVLGRMLGASHAAALSGALAWLLWVVFAALCAFAARYRPAHLRGELVGSAIVLLALAAMTPRLLVLGWPALAAWQGWRAWRA